MSDILQMHLKAHDQAIETRVGDETVILHLVNSTYYGLDPVGTRTWEGLKSGATPVEICEQIAIEFEVDRSTVENDVRKFLSDLLEQGLLVAE